MHVYLIPLGGDRYEPYYEHEDAAPADAGDDASPGLFARLSARFAAIIRDAERQRHEARAHQPPAGVMARLQRRMLAWVAERVAEQRLLWRLRGEDEAVLHIPDTLPPDAARRVFLAGMQKDADRHLKMSAVHALGLAVSAPFALIPGPNVFGYFFTFTVVGHFLSYRGARRGVGTVRWTVTPSAELSQLGRAVGLSGTERYAAIHEAAERLGLERLARFVERMTSTPA